MGKPLKDLTGQRFGRLTVLRRYKGGNAPEHKKTFWLCQCDCGNEVAVISYNLQDGRTKSCGCLRVENGRELCKKRKKA